jgi:CRP-like cAMP-binding protein
MSRRPDDDGAMGWGEMKQQHAIIQFVCEVFVCPPEVGEQMLAGGSLRSYSVETAIVRQGDRLTQCYLLVAGLARAFLYTSSGQVILLHEYRRGDIFGALDDPEAAIQDAEVVAQNAVEALVIQAAHLAMLAQQHGCIGLALSRLLVLRLRKATERIFERSGLSSVGRVHAELLRQARLRPDLVISPAPVLADLALVVATTRETASRAVGALERRGIIRRDGDSLAVVAPHRLEEMIL